MEGRMSEDKAKMIVREFTDPGGTGKRLHEVEGDRRKEVHADFYDLIFFFDVRS